ncbi:MAG: YdcF family protein [Candidatus Omnitrophica bacterium]|nr:YdcF family protein [Candidatus Omnitrophota bacterium]
MIHNKNIICISSIDWDFIWQGHQEIMSVLAANGNRVLFMENTGVRTPNINDRDRLWKRFLNWKKGFKGIRKLTENLYVYSPLVLPFPYSRLAVKINRILIMSVLKRWMDAMEFHEPIVWTFLPTPIVSGILNELASGLVVYYCIDDFSSSSAGAKKIKRSEERIIKKANLVFATSQKLYEYCHRFNGETHLFPFGVSIGGYNRAREKDIDMPDEMRRIKGPIIGYVGGIHKWVDMELLKKIARIIKDASIVLIGPKQADLCGLDTFENVYVLGKKEQRDLPKFVKFFDVGIIPYKITEYTSHVYPTKINEYLAMGKPVISTEIPEVVRFDRENGKNFIYFIKDESNIKNVIESALRDRDAAITEKRICVANENSWVSRIEKMCDLIEEKLSVLQLKMGRDGLERFRQFYAKARRRIIKVAATAAVLYFLIFYSPLMWFLASPLEISEKPKKVDAIVVFGGGVGETGSPGKSTIERAIFSADLYKQGFARYIIYSSGYTWKYNDAENMKLIAVSMGIPEHNIILDKIGDITYKNVKYTTDILRKNNLHKIILVTSPYNTRRAQLVYKKIANDIDVTYVPVANPQFYHREKPVRLEQIKAIVHEYLGIIYYAVMGYI